MKAFTFENVSESDIIKYSDKPESHLNSPENDERISLITYYRRQPKAVWEVPIQYNESTILYYLFYLIAKAIDLITPGKRRSPWLNLRFLASPFNFFGFPLVLLILFKFIL